MIIIHDVNDSPEYVPRVLEPLVRKVLASFPAVVVTGARQTGKSTLVRHLAAETGHEYLTLDDLETLDRARREPDALVRSADRLILDEVQRSPDLLLAVKRCVDEERIPGRFVLTGSANLLLLHRVSETLAGRAVHLTLWPLARRERLGRGTSGNWTRFFETPADSWLEVFRDEEPAAESWQDAARRGGYPTPALLPDAEARELWFAGYTRTYLERDLQDLQAVASLVDFRRLMRAACLRLGNLVNQTEIGRDVGLSQPTVHRHLGLLEASYQLVRLPAYAVNRTKRLIKTPKLFWSDTALALHLAGETEPHGPHLENLILTDLLAWRSTLVQAPELLYWRTAAGEEVDLVVEWQGKLLPIEVKSSRRPHLRDAKTLASFRKEYADTALPGLLVHGGEERTWLADGILALPWWAIL